MITIILIDGTKITVPSDRYIAKDGKKLIVVNNKGNSEKEINLTELLGIQEN